MNVFFQALRRVFQNHVKYRCLMLSFVHIMERNPLVSKRYGKIQSKRNETWTNNVLALKKGKYIATESQADIDYLVSVIALISRFWISEAAISNKGQSEQFQIDHYLKLVVRMLLPYITSKGKKALEANDQADGSSRSDYRH